MNRKRRLIRDWVAGVMLGVSAILFAVSLSRVTVRTSLGSAAEEMGKRVEERLGILDGYVNEALHANLQEWMDLESLPSDMVVYRYVEDTLQSWAHQFPIRSDDIRPRTLVQRLGDTRSTLSSPLADVGEQLSFMNLGPKWYLVKAVQGDGCKVIAGLEVVNELQAGSLNGINAHFKTADRYTVRPLSTSVGVPVTVCGEALFKLTDEKLSTPSRQYSGLLWVAIVLLSTALLLLLSLHPTLPWLSAVILIQGGLLSWLYYYGRNLDQVTQLFSPLLYADGSFFYSLGVVVIVNLAIDFLVLDLYLVRWTLLKALRRSGAAWLQWTLAVLVGLMIVAISAFIHLSFKSILVNSSICLELYKVTLLTPYTAVVYGSFLALTLSLPMLLQMLSPLLRSRLGIRYDVYSRTGRLVFSAAVGLYFVVASATLGFWKEQRRVDVWANRLAMDRDIALEIQLRSVEVSIASDPMIGPLSFLESGADIIRGRIVSAYMGRISQDYDIDVVLAGGNVGSHPLFLERIRAGVRLGDNSHFFYSALGSGRTSYTGLFSYYVPEYGPTSLLVTVESKHNREDRGYLSLLGISEPGRVSLPPIYSWAKYVSGRLVQYKGAYAYPTVFSGRLKELWEQHPGHHADLEGWCHFVQEVSEGEIIVISRPRTEALYFGVEFILLFILAYFFLTLLCWRPRGSGTRRYYQTRISLVMYISLILTLVAMSVFSVWFVQKRNNADMQSIMTSRINTLQSMLQERLRQVAGPEEMGSGPVVQSVEAVGNNLRCDITLFDISGRVLMSTTPEVYDRMILGHRLHHDAFREIIYGYKRFYMHRERVGRRPFYALYAPVFNSSGRMIAIVSSPFTDLTHDFESEAILHIATVVAIFLLLLMMARFITFEVVSRMFRPITEMSRRMRVPDVDHLQPLEYNQDDELTPLVQAYNRMVQDLGESSRRLAQVERDKAWTDMARRVAHDLKNPLTPIKLQLQMLMRMKATGNPLWQERFDEVAQTVLYHVDLLADSADQFSTFAKMYDQKPEHLDLDALVRQEVALFDAREDVKVDYYGLAEAWVMAPRPQLTRVVVNLITNAIQAVEELPSSRQILVAVRNGSEDGFYEIVVEDNGPGVAQQNQDKIFTPDFTTKTSGSGLGLAICRRIVEHCGGSISYSRSFTLGGACFTVKYPKA